MPQKCHRIALLRMAAGGKFNATQQLAHEPCHTLTIGHTSFEICTGLLGCRATMIFAPANQTGKRGLAQSAGWNGRRKRNYAVQQPEYLRCMEVTPWQVSLKQSV